MTSRLFGCSSYDHPGPFQMNRTSEASYELPCKERRSPTFKVIAYRLSP